MGQGFEKTYTNHTRIKINLQLNMKATLVLLDYP